MRRGNQQSHDYVESRVLSTKSDRAPKVIEFVQQAC